MKKIGNLKRSLILHKNSRISSQRDEYWLENNDRSQLETQSSLNGRCNNSTILEDIRTYEVHGPHVGRLAMILDPAADLKVKMEMSQRIQEYECLINKLKMCKNKKQAGGHGPPREQTDTQEQEMDIRKTMKDVENFSYSHMSWKERKKIENRNVVSLGGKPQKNQRLPLSVARPMMKKQKEREQKMLQERLILGQFGGKLGGGSKRSTGKHKPENRGLKSSEGHFRNGILNVKHLLNSTPSRDRETGTNMSNTWKGKGGKKKNGNKGAGGKKHR